MTFKLGRSKPLERRTPLKSTDSLKRSHLRRRPKPRVETPEQHEARMLWKSPQAGYCQCGCSPPTLSVHLERHHVVGATKLKEIGREDVLFDLRNSMLLAPLHHARHTSHFSCIKIEYVPVAALQFALEVLGEGGSAAYLSRHYDCTVTL